MVAILDVIDTDDLMIITNKGVMIRQSVEHIRTIGRNTQGVKLISLKEGELLNSVERIADRQEDQTKD